MSLKCGRRIYNYYNIKLYVTMIRICVGIAIQLASLVSNLMPVAAVFVDVDAVAVMMYELRDCPFGSYLTTRDPITPPPPAALH